MFSPFQKPLESLDATDLERLRHVAEGWYVEYKSELSKAPDIAKSISAFANTYGGWVFYGVGEKSKSEPVAESFLGINLGNVDAALQRIRQAVAQHMNPAAHFDVRAIQGDGVSLAADKIVIGVRVPQSPTAPHVHTSGKIYRRVADGSEPKAENDRHLLDQMFRRSDELKKDFKNWVGRDPEFSKDEAKVPYLRLLMIADPWGEENPWLETDAMRLKSLFGKEKGLMAAVPLNSIYTSHNGYIARQANGNDPHNLGLTWRFRESLVSDVLVPLNFYNVDSPYALGEHLGGYEQAERFVRILEASNYAAPRVVDLNLLFNLLIGLVETQRRLLAEAKWTKPYFIKAKLLNVWRTIPFLDVDHIIEGFEADGLPVCLDKIVTTPPGSDPDTFQKVEAFVTITDEDGERADIVIQALTILQPIARAWGLSFALDADRYPDTFRKLHEASVLAIELQKGKTHKTPLPTPRF